MDGNSTLRPIPFLSWPDENRARTVQRMQLTQSRTQKQLEPTEGSRAAYSSAMKQLTLRNLRMKANTVSVSCQLNQLSSSLRCINNDGRHTHRRGRRNHGVRPPPQQPPRQHRCPRPHHHQLAPPPLRVPLAPHEELAAGLLPAPEQAAHADACASDIELLHAATVAPALPCTKHVPRRLRDILA